MNDLGSCVGAYTGLTRLRVGVVTSVLALLVGGAATVAAPALPAAAATAGFVQQASAHGSGKSLAVTTGANVASGDRLVVEVGTWSSDGATASSVTDSLGDSFVEVTHFTAADDTEMSIWTAPVPSGGADTITVKPSSSADMGVATLEYSGLSTVAGVTAVDQVAHSVGTTATAGTVQSRRHVAYHRTRRAGDWLLRRFRLWRHPHRLAPATPCGLTCRPRATWSSWPRTSRCPPPAPLRRPASGRGPRPTG